jgi:hypothetical protein
MLIGKNELFGKFIVTVAMFEQSGPKPSSQTWYVKVVLLPANPSLGVKVNELSALIVTLPSAELLIT